MCQILSAMRYISLFLSLLIPSGMVEVILIVVPTDEETNQKSTKVCAGTLVGFNSILTLAECPDQVRSTGPHAMVFSERTGIDILSKKINNFSWKCHKYFDGENMRKDIAIVKRRDAVEDTSSTIIGNFCPSCVQDCYTVGWNTINKIKYNLSSINELDFGKTKLRIIKEEFVIGSTTDISATSSRKDENLTVDLGSPLICQQTIGIKNYTGVIGILLRKPDDQVLKFRTMRGLLTWVSSQAMQTYLAPSGKLDQAKVCTSTDCDKYEDDPNLKTSPSIDSISSYKIPINTVLLPINLFIYFLQYSNL